MKRQYLIGMAAVLVSFATVAIGSSEYGAGSEESELGVFDLEQLSDTWILAINGSAENRDQDTSSSVNLNAGLSAGKLLFPVHGVPQAYLYGTVGGDTDDRFRLNLSVGSYVPVIGGELNFGYRALSGDLRDYINDHDYSDTVTEHGYSLGYTRYLDSFLREFGADWLHTSIAGSESGVRQWSVETEDFITSYRYSEGFGDFTSDSYTAKTAFGSDEMSGVVLGYRFDFEAGYEEVVTGNFSTTPGITDIGFAGSAGFTVDTQIGRFKTTYREGSSGSNIYTGWQYGPAEVYYRDIQYDTSGTDEQIFGVGLTFDLLTMEPASTTPLFASTETGYRDVHRMKHHSQLAGIDFVAKPKIQTVTEISSVTAKEKLKPEPVVTPDPVPVCGDNICESGESRTCPDDCIIPPVCGNEVCEDGETAESCPTDCYTPPPDTCGDNVCDERETTESCPNDCTVDPTCGNGICDDSETWETCPDDCSAPPPNTCGDGVCGDNESYETCPQDCTLVPTCGDGTCSGDENSETCPQDCGEPPPVCGDGTCDADENSETCPMDCGEPPPSLCGNGVCDWDAGEDPEVCPEDCNDGPPPSFCGDGTCDADENSEICPADCGEPPPATCGDGFCNWDGGENPSICPEDCGD